MTGPLLEGQVPQVQELRKCNGCSRVTAGCRKCKDSGMPAPYDHLCQVCHRSGLGDVKHEWESAQSNAAGPLVP